MALITMCCYDTAENGRSEYTIRTLRSLHDTVNFAKHRLIIIDNGSCEETKNILKVYMNSSVSQVIHLDKNIGTAEGINLAWKLRNAGENAIKIDNDVVIYNDNWADDMEKAVEKNPKIGLLGLKRKDLEQRPDHPNPTFKSKLTMLPHNPGERWMVIEETADIMGTCCLHSSALLDKVGYMKQYGVYGFDDVLFSLRSKLAGFTNAFLPHIEIDHIDTGGTEYMEEKRKLAHEAWPKYQQAAKDYTTGKEPLYYNPFLYQTTNQNLRIDIPNVQLGGTLIHDTRIDKYKFV